MWATILVRGMEQRILPEADPRLLTRSRLGLYSSIWHWYRPKGQVSLDEVPEFFIRRKLAVLGLPPELADGDRSARPSARPTAAGNSRSTRSRRVVDLLGRPRTELVSVYRLGAIVELNSVRLGSSGWLAAA